MSIPIELIEEPKSGKRKRVIVSGGGTGGHIYPAISIANALNKVDPSIKILFVGAEGRMEMEKVPAAGYKIIGLPVRGFDRKNMFRNISVLYRLIRSIFIARGIIRRFHPDIAIGVGGYASAPVLLAASTKGVPYIIQEQNSYAGVANKLLARNAKKICVAYEGMERFFPKKKIVVTGNPVRQELVDCHLTHRQSLSFFDLEQGKQTLLILGGSLGARTINETVAANLDMIPSHIQVIWQTGKNYFEQVTQKVGNKNNVKVFEFIQRMDLAYAAADLVISRAGAGTISELSTVGKPCILIPSPNVSEDHQTKNAMTLVEKEAAIMIRDNEAAEKLMPMAISMVQNPEILEPLADHVRLLGKFHSAESIAKIVMDIMNRK